MSETHPHFKHFVSTVLSSHYLLPIAGAVLVLILGTALYVVSEDTNYMRDQLRENFNDQQSILARQAATQLGSDLSDIAVEMERLGQMLTRTPELEELTQLMRSSCRPSTGTMVR